MSLYVSGACDGVYLTVQRVHTAKPPVGAVLVLRYPEKGRRKPRAGDQLDYQLIYGQPRVFAPLRAKAGATPTGRGVRVYLPAEVAADLEGLAVHWGRPRGEVVALLVHGARIAAGATVAAPPHLAGARVDRACEGWLTIDCAHPTHLGERIAVQHDDVALLPPMMSASALRAALEANVGATKELE